MSSILCGVKLWIWVFIIEILVAQCDSVILTPQGEHMNTERYIGSHCTCGLCDVVLKYIDWNDMDGK